MPIAPFKTDAPLVIDTNAVLPFPEKTVRAYSAGDGRCARNVSLLAKTRKEVEIKKILTCCARPNYNNALLTATFVAGLLSLCAVSGN